MSIYKPMKITGMATGLVQSREEFLLPDDAYPTLENAFVWRERIRRRQGLQTLGRLRRILTAQSLGNTAASPWSFNIFTVLGLLATEPNANVEPGSVVITIAGPIIFTDTGLGTLTSVTPGNSGTINYITGDVTLTHTAGVGVATTIDFNYFPGLPVMGLRTRELTATNNEQMVAWDTKYAYRFVGGFQEFIPGYTWTGTDYNFFWTTNYWVSPAPANNKIFWATNFSGTGGDPIRYTDFSSSVWVDFAPTINAGLDKLQQCLALLPFRGRLVAFNTLEGATLAGSAAYRQRIRWSAIGNPISDVSPIFPLAGNVNAQAWRDDIRGQGGFIDIPTAEDITAVGFVRDNCIIYCERSTWQLRYTGRSIQPFQIERVNSELGAESTFSAVQFDTSLVGIGDKGIVECDSFKSDRIDIKIPDLVFEFKNETQGTQRVAGIRDFQQKLAYWIYHYNPGQGVSLTYPNRRLVYNYENDSWAIFTDSLTALGTYQTEVARKWNNTHSTWEESNFPWLDVPNAFPALIGGNQQGYVMYLSSNLQPQVTNDPTLLIKNITGNGTDPTEIEVINHNLQPGYIIKITGIITGTDFEDMNGQVYSVVPVDADNLKLFQYDPVTDQYSMPAQHAAGTYIGEGEVSVRDNFNITSKKFNFLDQGENIQMGFVDILMNSTSRGAISLNVFLDYNTTQPVNVYPQNSAPTTLLPDTFFNSVVETSTTSGLEGSKVWKRIFCPVRGAFLTLTWTLNNFQMQGPEQESDVQIDAQILYIRKAGRQLPVEV